MFVLFSSFPLQGKLYISSSHLQAKKLNKIISWRASSEHSDLSWLSVTLLTRPLAHFICSIFQTLTARPKALSAIKIMISTQATLRSRSSYGRRDSLSAIIHATCTCQSSRFMCTSSRPITHASIEPDGA